MSYDGIPAVAGTELPRPNGVTESPEAVRMGVQLANGSLRAYSAGVRSVFELSWNRLPEATLATLRSLLAPPYVAYRHLDGKTYVVETEPPSAAAIAGTSPTRFSVSVTLREQSPR